MLLRSAMRQALRRTTPVRAGPERPLAFLPSNYGTALNKQDPYEKIRGFKGTISIGAYLKLN